MNTRTILATVGIVCTGLGAAVWAEIENTAHNFTNETWGGGEICKPCHAPHNGVNIGYLWAHTLSTATYTLFEGTGPSSPGGVDELDTHSRMCLSCHDGTVALGDFHNGGGPNVYMTGDENLTTDLSDDHPIGEKAIYPTGGNSRFNAATFFPGPGRWGFGGTGFPSMPLFEFEGNQVVACSTCHTPHGRAGIPTLLRKLNTGSDLCLTCHIK